jgi:hypothetical protein
LAFEDFFFVDVETIFHPFVQAEREEYFFLLTPDFFRFGFQNDAIFDLPELETPRHRFFPDREGDLAVALGWGFSMNRPIMLFLL